MKTIKIFLLATAVSCSNNIGRTENTREIERGRDDGGRTLSLNQGKINDWWNYVVSVAAPAVDYDVTGFFVNGVENYSPEEFMQFSEIIMNALSDSGLMIGGANNAVAAGVWGRFFSIIR